MPAAFASAILEDAAEWVALDLEPGYNIVACFIPDRENPQVPHSVARQITLTPSQKGVQPVEKGVAALRCGRSEAPILGPSRSPR